MVLFWLRLPSMCWQIKATLYAHLLGTNLDEINHSPFLSVSFHIQGHQFVQVLFSKMQTNIWVKVVVTNSHLANLFMFIVHFTKLIRPSLGCVRCAGRGGRWTTLEGPEIPQFFSNFSNKICIKALFLSAKKKRILRLILW